MRPLIIKANDSPEKRAITRILLKKNMRMKDLWEIHRNTRKHQKPLAYRSFFNRLSRSVALSRTVNLLSALGHTVAIVPTGAAVTIENEIGVVACNVPARAILMVTPDEAGYRLTHTSLSAEPQSPREEW